MQFTRDSAIKWSGSIATAISVALTAFDVIPLNKFIGIIGSALWFWAGWRLREPALYWLNALFLLLYLIGFVFHR